MVVKYIISILKPGCAVQFSLFSCSVDSYNSSNVNLKVITRSGGAGYYGDFEVCITAATRLEHMHPLLIII